MTLLLASPGRFAWMLGTGGAPKAPPPDEAELAAACAMALGCWQVLPAIAPRLLAWGGPLARGDDARRVRDRVVSLDALAVLQLQITRDFVSAFERAGLPHVWLKGSALRFLAYPAPELRCGKDLDVAVAPERLHEAERIALDLGFIRAEWDPPTRRFQRANPRLRSLVEAGHYELGFLARRILVSDLTGSQEAAIRRDLPSQVIWHLTGDDRLACYVTVDIHHGLSLDIPVAPLLATARVWPASTVAPLRVPAPAWLLLHLVFKIYWEGVHSYGTGAYQYADLARLLPLLDEAELAHFSRLLAALKLEAAAHYVLRRLATDLGMALPAAVEQLVAETARAPANREPIRVNDLGDMWPKLWGHR